MCCTAEKPARNLFQGVFNENRLGIHPRVCVLFFLTEFLFFTAQKNGNPFRIACESSAHPKERNEDSRSFDINREVMQS